MPMSCGRYERLIQDYVDQTISEGEKRELNEHIKYCDHCREDLQDMVKMVSLMEDISFIQEEKGKKRARRITYKCITACFAVFSAFFLVVYDPLGIGLMNFKGNLPVYRNYVFADDTEQLPIPLENPEVILLRPKSRGMVLLRTHRSNEHGEHQYIDVTWVYPSAYSQIPTFKTVFPSDHYVFVDVPDKKTLMEIMTFITGSKIEFDEENIQFPTSVALVQEEGHSTFKAFQFPKSKDKVSRLFEHFTEVSYQQPLQLQ
ncbi:anti-sigma factor [Tepidibacillus infernus]|uniref:Anti-sigma-W factor RsiW n=1 Tax=Tepidibacillus decaturensis TaxID=1413211 RepID=A0A135L4S0_9BACI|nr:zf-HC2 domain-containing protein [Tepidibacillus decaturensis]KXG44005.1 hypothetical protein U473_08300 [Tepidibacillus decaturensis]